MNEFELKPCPFCGGKAEVFKDDYGKYLVTCNECGVMHGVELEDGTELEYGWRAAFESGEMAVGIWNSRTHVRKMLDDDVTEYTDKKAVFILNIIRESAELMLEEASENQESVEACADAINAIEYAIKAIKDRADLEDKHWSECRQIAHYDNELNPSECRPPDKEFFEKFADRFINSAN